MPIPFGSRRPVAITEAVREYVNKWWAEVGFLEISSWIESFASCAIEGNELAEELLGTVERIKNKEQIGDAYLLQLAWFIRDVKDKEVKKTKEEIIKN